MENAHHSYFVDDVLRDTLARMMRCFVIVPMRTYFRYTCVTHGKAMLWRRVAEHLWSTETNVNTRTSSGVQMFVNARDIVGRYVYYFGIWEPNLSRWISERLNAGDTFVDVGANIGYYSLLASTIVGSSGRVVAIEPLPALFRMLTHNVALNDARNIRAVNVAAWDSEGVLPIFTKPNDDPSGLSSLMPQWAARWKLRKDSDVATQPLCNIVLPEEAARARIIKIDVEGAEWRVILGLERLLDSCRSDLEVMVEICPRLLSFQGKTSQDVLDLFQRKGFYAYHIENDYSAESYFTHRPFSPPVRINSVSDKLFQADLVFSRVDAAKL